MTVASGLYGLTLEKMLIDTLGWSLEIETSEVAMVTDTHTPDFDLDDFFDDLDNEVSGTGYTSPGKDLTSTEVTVSSGTLTFDAADVSWTSSTISNAEAAVGHQGTGTGSADELTFMSDFGSPVSTSSGTLTIQWNASVIFTIDVTP